MKAWEKCNADHKCRDRSFRGKSAGSIRFQCVIKTAIRRKLHTETRSNVNKYKLRAFAFRQQMIDIIILVNFYRFLF